MENLIYLKDLKPILLGAVMIQKWNDDEENFDVVYTSRDIFDDEEFYPQFGEMIVSQMYSFTDSNGDYLVITIEEE